MPITQTPPPLDVDHLGFAYDGIPVLSDVNFQIASGDYVGLIGPNGSGKTTLLRIILGLLEPTEGSVRLFGETQKVSREIRSRIGYVPQRISQQELVFPATVEEVVASGRVARFGLFHRLRRSDRSAIHRAMEIAGVEPFRKRLIRMLSGGERQRVYIARALAGEPLMLILDEPTVGVDISAQEKFYSFLTSLNREHKLTILLVSHDLDVIAKEITRLIGLNRTIVFSGSPKEFFAGKAVVDLYAKQAQYIHHHHHV